MLAQIWVVIMLAQIYVNAGNCISRKHAKVHDAVRAMPVRKLRMIHTTSSLDFKTINISQDDQRLLRSAVNKRIEEIEEIETTTIKPLNPAAYAIDKMKQRRKVVVIPTAVIKQIIDRK